MILYYLVETGKGYQVYSNAYVVRKLSKNNNSTTTNKIKKVYIKTSNKNDIKLDKDIINLIPEDLFIQIKPEEVYSDICLNYIKFEPAFKWILDRYVKPEYIELFRRLALTNDSNDLYLNLNQLWFALPESEFNIKVNPDGWKEFLTVIDSYKQVKLINPDLINNIINI